MALRVNQELKRFSVRRQLNSEKLLHRDLSKGKEYYQIQVVNGVDNEPYPIDFMYVSENCEASQINIDRTITSLQVRHYSTTPLLFTNIFLNVFWIYFFLLIDWIYYLFSCFFYWRENFSYVNISYENFSQNLDFSANIGYIFENLKLISRSI